MTDSEKEARRAAWDRYQREELSHPDHPIHFMCDDMAATYRYNLRDAVFMTVSYVLRQQRQAIRVPNHMAGMRYANLRAHMQMMQDERNRQTAIGDLIRRAHSAKQVEQSQRDMKEMRDVVERVFA